MEKARKLKMPDGSAFDLAIPEGFGAPILALNDAGGIKTPSKWFIAAGVFAAAAILAAYMGSRK